MPAGGSNHRTASPILQRGATKSTHTGAPMPDTSPAGVSFPVSGSSLCAARLLLFCPAAISQRPSGEMAKLRGSFTPAGAISTLVSFPSAPIANTGWATTNREFGNNDGYAARVLQGVWAAAPYLHNGSVPTLADLLEPTSKRPPSFKIGSAYDPKTVGLAKEQTQFGATLMTTDCSDRGSGNSRCGHEGPDYGTELSILQKRALLEYLKKL